MVKVNKNKSVKEHLNMKFITEIHLQDLIHISQYIAYLTQKNTYFFVQFRSFELHIFHNYN